MLQHNFLIRCGLSMNILLAFRYKVLFSSRFKKSLPRMATQQQPQKDHPCRNRTPNSFVSIRINSAEIKDNISMVQEEMIKLRPEMANIIQNPSKLHITLMVLSLQSGEDIEKAKKATAVAYQRIATDLVDPLILTFDKIGTFTSGKNKTNVVFANLCNDTSKQKLMKLAGGGVPVKHVDGIPPNVPHGVFLVKKPKLTDLPFESNQPSIPARLPCQSKSGENAGERPSVILQEFGQVDSCSGGSLVMAKPQDIVADSIDLSPSSVQTVETNFDTSETESSSSPLTVPIQNKSDCSAMLVVDDRTDDKVADIDNQSHLFQEKFHPLIGVALGNIDDTVMMDQQEGQDNDDDVDNDLPVEDAVDQDEQRSHENTHCSNQQKHSLDHDVPPGDGDVHTINQDSKSLDQDKECFDQDEESLDQNNQDSEDDYNPFSHLQLFSDDKSDGTPAPLKTSKKRRRRKAKSKPTSGGDGRKKTEKIIPDSFVAVRFSSHDLQQKLEVVQQHMIAMDKKLKPTMIPLVKLHITLMTLQLNNDRSLIERARECLCQCCCKLKEIDQREILVSVRNLQSFRNRVVYAAVEDNKAKEQLVQLAELVCATFTENGLKSTDDKTTFTPHLTIAKTTRTFGNQKVKVIDPKCYEEHKDDCFGVQPINTLELLSMTQPTDGQGYYYCYGKEPFSNDTTVAQDCPENVDTDVEQSMDNEAKETLEVVSAPCTAVKFIPQVLLTKTQDPTSSTEKITPTIDKDKDTTKET